MKKGKTNASRTNSGRAGPWEKLPKRCLNCESSSNGTMENINNRKLAKFSLWPHDEDEDGTTIHFLFCFNCGHINNVKLITLENDKFRFIYVEDEDGDIFYQPDPKGLYRYFKENKNDPEINEYINSLAYPRMIIRGYLPKDPSVYELIETARSIELKPEKKNTQKNNEERKSPSYRYAGGEVWHGPLDHLGRPTGKGEIDLGNGNTYTGSCKEGVPFGHGVLTYNEYRYQGGWNVFPEGRGKIECKHWFTYDGEWKNGMLHGGGIAKWLQTGEEFSGRWHEGKIANYLNRITHPDPPDCWPFFDGLKKPIFNPWGVLEGALRPVESPDVGPFFCRFYSEEIGWPDACMKGDFWGGDLFSF
jgi:hypothetical protein